MQTEQLSQPSLPLNSRPHAARMVAIEWRVAPAHVEPGVRDIDIQWTRHSWCPADRAEAEVASLAARQSENGFFEFRIKP